MSDKIIKKILFRKIFFNLSIVFSIFLIALLIVIISNRVDVFFPIFMFYSLVQIFFMINLFFKIMKNNHLASFVTFVVVLIVNISIMVFLNGLKTEQIIGLIHFFRN
jgi:hypothetical protein